MLKDFLELNPKDEEFNEYIYNIKIKEFIEKYIIPIKLFLWALFLLILGIMWIHAFSANIKNFSYDFIKSLAIFECLVVISFCILSLWPQKFYIIPQMLMFHTAITMFDICLHSEKLYVYEFVMPWMSFIYLMDIIIPIQWKSNCSILIIGMAYFAYNLYQRDGVLSENFIGSMIGTSFYFIAGSLTLNRKVKYLYAAIRKSV